jgi:class 3 adenylate cyclase/tetratricopeptide (TPR) repeat protein
MNVMAGSGDLARFVPTFLLTRLADRATLFSPSFSQSADVAVLFADISGFTALSEKLGSRGPDGVEELTQVLNAYFGKLIETIQSHGGDVVKFAGDALLAFWPAAGEHDLARATRLAAQCGLRVQETLATFTTPQGHRLYLKVGVGAGHVFFVSLGGVYNRWESVMVGAPVVEATLATTKAEAGSVVVGTQAWRAMKDRAEGVEVTPDYTRLVRVDDPETPVALAKPEVGAESVPNMLFYIPAAIHRRLAARQSGWLAEMRRLTVIFVNLPELDADTPLAEGQELIRALQTELYRFEGSVNKLSIDEKGVTLVAALGLPPLAHEDDPQRGIMAGLAIHAKLAQLNWHGSVGITTGRVFCGTIGSEERCEYTIIGHVVNLSARLMQAAKGSIYCDETTYKSAQTRVAWEVLPPVVVKGRTEPVPVFRPLAPQKSGIITRPTQTLVGRSTELFFLEALLRRLAREQTGGVVLIEGEAGIGKSTLVGSLLGQAAEFGLTTWLGAALPIERSTPFYVWRAVFRNYFRLDGSKTDLESQRRKVLDQLAADPDLIELAPLLDVVLSLDFAATPLTAEMFGEVRLTATNNLLIRLLKRQTEKAPLQIILEDCHWMDSASWSLARQAAQLVPVLLLVLVTRPLTEPLPRDYIPLAAAPTTKRLPLGPLDPEETLSLVKRRLGVKEVPPPLVAWLHAKSQGNPFFVEEIAYALRDTAKLHIQEGRCTVAPGVDLRSLPFPDNVQGVVTSRIDRLTPGEQLTLKVASVIGRTFSSHLLHDICPIEDDKPLLGQHLDTLVVQSLTTQEAPEPDPAFSFRHVITQEVAYQMMPPTQRRSLHQAVAEWYESHYRADLSPFFPLLAKHWCNTDQIAKAIDYLEKSGENAMRDFAHEEALTFYSQALSLDEQSGSPCEPLRKARWWRQSAESYYNLGDHGRAREHFLTALQLLGFTGTHGGWRCALATVWEFAKQKVHRLFPGWFVGRAGGEKAIRFLEAARCFERLTQIYYLNNEKLPTIHGTFRALNLSESVGESPELARSYSHATVVSGLLMMHQTARAHAERARAVATAVNQSECTAYVEFIRGIYFVTVGDWEECEANAYFAVEIAKRIGQKRRWDEAMITLANSSSRSGDYRRSAEFSRELHESGTRRGVPQVQIWGLSWHLLCLLALEPDGPAVASLEKALADCLAHHPTVLLGDQILGYGLLALSYWRRGEEKAAQEATERADAVIRRTDQISHYLLPAFAGLVEVYLGLWKKGAADVALVRELQGRTRHLLKVLGQFAMMYPIAQATKWQAWGNYYSLLGSRRQAIRAWKKSLAWAESHRMPFEQAEAHAELAMHLPPSDPTQALHLAKARELFTRIGARYNLRKLKRVS